MAQGRRTRIGGSLIGNMTFSLRPHHDGSPVHVSDPAPEIGDVVRVRLRVPHVYGQLDAVWVRSTPDREPIFTRAQRLAAVEEWEWWDAPLPIRNLHNSYRWMLVASDGRVSWLNQAGLSDIETRDSEDFAVVAGNPPPTWLPDAVMYQVFPDRFARSAADDDRSLPPWAIPADWTDSVDPVAPARSQQFYGGNLDGIVEHLDHLVELGVTLLYLTPVFPASSNHRYDATTFDEVDPLLGGDEAYIRLIEAAHARGIHVIGDLTTNHSGDRHEWFRSAYAHAGAPEERFYYFTDDANASYESWLGFATLPKFDWSSPELARRFVDGPESVVAKWLQPPYSLDGWRIDVANMTGRLGAADHNAEVRRAIRRTMTSVHPDTYLVAESTGDATGDLQGDGWQGAMTYVAFTRPLWNWLGDTSTEPYIDALGRATTEPWYFGQPVERIPRFTARQFATSVDRFFAGIPWSVRLGTMNTLDSHDTARFATHAHPSVIPVAVGLSLTLPGLPVIWAGDEFGEQGADGETSRTPMPWHRIDEPAVQERLTLYRGLVALRHRHPALGAGGMRWIHSDENVIVFVREAQDETLLVLAARGDVDVRIPAGAVVGADAATAAYGDADLEMASDGSIILAGRGPVFAVWALRGIGLPTLAVRPDPR